MAEGTLIPLANLKKISEKIPEWLEALPEMPELIYETLQKVKYYRQHTVSLEKEKSAIEAMKVAKKKETAYRICNHRLGCSRSFPAP